MATDPEVTHWSTIGFEVSEPADLEPLVFEAVRQGRPFKVRRGWSYVDWSLPSGAALILQLQRRDLVSMHPHFNGRTSMRIGLTSWVERSDRSLMGR